MHRPERQIRASFGDETITVYQAYSPAIAVHAAAHGTFLGTPFKLGRMTWIKPSFLWMMYRSGWATKPGQEHVLAITMTRAGFDETLSLASLSHFDPATYADEVAWMQHKENSPVRVQWDPERNISLEPQPWRAIQIGLSGDATRRFAGEWITAISDITPFVREINGLISDNEREAAIAMLPTELVYPYADALKPIIGAS